jgi:hypothetical protein
MIWDSADPRNDETLLALEENLSGVEIELTAVELANIDKLS